PQSWHVSFSSITSAMDSSESCLDHSVGSPFIICVGGTFHERAVSTESLYPVLCLLLSTSARKSGTTGLVDRVPSGDGQVHVPHPLDAVGGVESCHPPCRGGQGVALGVSLLTLRVGRRTDGFQELRVTLHRGHLLVVLGQLVHSRGSGVFQPVLVLLNRLVGDTLVEVLVLDPKNDLDR